MYGVISLRTGSLFMDDFTFWPLETTNTSESAFLLFGSLNIVFFYFFYKYPGQSSVWQLFYFIFRFDSEGKSFFIYIFLFKPPVKWGGRICSGESGDEMNLWCEEMRCCCFYQSITWTVLVSKVLFGCFQGCVVCSDLSPLCWSSARLRSVSHTTCSRLIYFT